VRTQISVDNTLVRLNLLRLAFSQHLAMRQAVDMICHIHDDAHIVFDDEESNTELSIASAHPVYQAIDERGIDARRRLVKQ